MQDGPEARRERRKQVRRARRRAEIIRAAEILAAEHGPDGFTTEQLAAQLEISQASVFYYFSGGRPELMTAVALRQQHRWMDELTEVARQAPTGIDALAAVVRRVGELHDEDADKVDAVIDALVSAPWGKDLLDEHIARVNDQIDLLEQRLLEDQRAGRLHPAITDLRRFATMVMHLPYGHIQVSRMRRMAGGRSIHADSALFDELIALLRRGTSSPAEGARASVRDG